MYRPSLKKLYGWVNLGKGMTLRDILASTKSVAEGVATALSAYELSQKYNIDMPIIAQVYQVIYKDKALLRL